MKLQKGDQYQLLFIPANITFTVKRFKRVRRKHWARVVCNEIYGIAHWVPVNVLKSEHCRKIEPVIEPVVIAEDDMDEVMDAMDEVEAPKSAGRIKGLFKRILARTV